MLPISKNQSLAKGQIYEIPHTCYAAQWSTADDGGYEIFGRVDDDMINRFDSVIELSGFRCIELVDRVREHWVIDTWLSTSEGFTSVKTKLVTHGHLRRLTKGLAPSIKT